jgi:formate dehydrogenase iron-sulfur subunit
MAAVMMFMDTSKCIGCKACQVACKQWHSLPAEKTVFTGSYTNPPDLSGSSLTFVNFQEMLSGGKLMYTFLRRQCMHCNKAVCQAKCPKGIEKTSEGFVVFNDDCIPANVRMTPKDIKALGHPPSLDELRDYFLNACPYRIPRFDGTKFVKCDHCFNRFGGNYTTYRNGNPTTACELTCPPGAIVTGPKATIMAKAKERLTAVKKQYSKATLWGGRGRVVFLLTESPAKFEVKAGADNFKLGNYGLVKLVP